VVSNLDGLRTRSGGSLTILNQSVPVYNIEVHGEHVYQVGELGLLVHNAYDLAKLTKLGQKAKNLTGNAARTKIISLAEKAGLIVESGGKHLRVVDEAGKLITTIPHSPTNPFVIKGIVDDILDTLR
jgi:hypothetical protein